MDLMPDHRHACSSMDNAQTTETLVASLISLLEAGTSPRRREWDAVSSGHHGNLRSGRRYRGGNPIPLTMGMHLRGLALPYWCGYRHAAASVRTSMIANHGG
jgi:antirestriction protein ArdC